MADAAAAIEYAREHRDVFLDQFKELLAIPSVSTLPEHKDDIQRAAEWLVKDLNRLGMTRAEIMPTDGHPVVYGEWLGAPGKPTVLVYGHYDVQPVDPIEEWDSDPFEGTIRGDYIYARGASDMKGQLLTHLNALEALVQQGDPPVNLKYLLEGEEEIGSPSLAKFIDEHGDLLEADFVLNCDGRIIARETPSIIYSLRGLAYFELEVRGPKKDLHSGLYGGSVRNPVAALCELVAGMHDDQGRVTLPGFYDRVRELDDEERKLLAQTPYSDEDWLESTGALALWGEAGYTTVERIGARPALDVNGIWGGFTGEGAKTVLPAVVRAKVSMRLVADQQPADVKEQLEAYLEEQAPAGVTWSLREMVHGPSALIDRNSKPVQAVADALETVYGQRPIFCREGGTIPVVGLLEEKLGLQTVMIGFALPDDDIHSPNEHQYLPNFFKGIETHIHFLAELAK